MEKPARAPGDAGKAASKPSGTDPPRKILVGIRRLNAERPTKIRRLEGPSKVVPLTPKVDKSPSPDDDETPRAHTRRTPEAVRGKSFSTNGRLQARPRGTEVVRGKSFSANGRLQALRLQLSQELQGNPQGSHTSQVAAAAPVAPRTVAALQPVAQRTVAALPPVAPRNVSPQKGARRCIFGTRTVANDRLQALRRDLEQAETPVLMEFDVEMQSVDDVEPMDWQDIDEARAVAETHILRIMRHSDGFTGTLVRERRQYAIKLPSKLTAEPSFLAVIDTNVFISNIVFLTGLLEYNKPQLGRATLVVPYIVMQEIDGFKVTRKTDLARRAVHFLRQNRTHERQVIQPASDADQWLISVHNADDLVLNCCLQLREVIAQDMGPHRPRIMLISNDIHLGNKAAANEIDVYTMKEFCASFGHPV